MAGWIVYGVAAFGDAFLLCSAAFFMILFSDLEADRVNPYDFCSRVNSLVLPESAGHGFLTLLFLLFGEWWIFLVNVPLLCYHVYRYVTSTHLYYATDAIKTLDARKQESNVRFGFYLTCLFYYIYRMHDRRLILELDNGI